MDKGKLKGHAALWVANIVWGLNAPIGKSVLWSEANPGGVNPFALSVYRMVCAALLFVRNEAAIYAAVGVLGFAMACVFATFYAVATKAVPENANEVAGLMIMAISAGAVSGPVCGAIVRAWGNPHLGMLFVAACVAYICLLYTSDAADD